MEAPDEYAPRQWSPQEKPQLPGSPSTPEHPPARRVAFGVVALVLAMAGGLSNGLVIANLLNLQGSFGAYTTEMQWLPAAYVMANVSMNLLLVKFRQQYGLQLFTELFLALYALVAFAHLVAHNLPTAIAVRAAHGLVGAALTVLAANYCVQAFPPAHRVKALVLGFGASQLALPLARVISSELLEIGEWQGLVWFEAGLSLLALGCVLLLKLPRGDRSRAFEKIDFVTFALFAPGVAMLCAALALGRYVWWLEAPWVGVCLAGAIALTGAALLIERGRALPLLDVRWLGSGQIARLALSVLLIRVVLAEGAAVVGLFQALGLHTDQMHTMFRYALAGSVLGLAVSALTIKPTNLNRSLLVALALIAAGALIDAGITSDTRPEQMYLSQFMLAFGGTFFFGPTLLAGFGPVLQQPRYLVSLSVMFSITQNLGGLLGNALVGTFQVVREKYHSSYLVEHLSLADPQVAARVQAAANALAGGLADPAARNGQGLAALAAAATRQANVLAYNDVFMVLGVIAIAVMAWLLVAEFWTFCVGCVGRRAAR
jgi:MFS family permease